MIIGVVSLPVFDGSSLFKDSYGTNLKGESQGEMIGGVFCFTKRTGFHARQIERLLYNEYEERGCGKNEEGSVKKDKKFTIPWICCQRMVRD
ncbi:MAG: hypothetical protein E4G90_05135 [Gemmatimonadales bacterium]|nr:MAG: hypothetical protein E4G90_05135 [Gemmatimonadales bacterium]